MGYAFISYSTRNQQQADEMNRLLQKNGIETWMAPGNIPPGSKYAQAINVAIKECACVVLMLSKQAQDSVWVAKEIERAVNYRKPVFPVQLDDVVLNDEFELYISTNQVLCMRNVSESAPELGRLLASVQRQTGTKPAANSDTLNALSQRLSESEAVAIRQSASQNQEDDVLEDCEQDFELEDIAVELIYNDQICIDFCNCIVKDGEVLLSFWVENRMAESVRLFGENILVNGRINNPKYTFHYFGSVSGSEKDFCYMILNGVSPQGTVTVSGHIEVDDSDNNQLFRTPGFTIKIDFDDLTQTVKLDTDVQEDDSEADLQSFALEDISFELLDNDQVHVEFCNCEVEDGEVFLSFWIKNLMSQEITLFGQNICVDGKANSVLDFDCLGNVSGQDSGFCQIALTSVSPKGTIAVSGHIEVDDSENNQLFRTPGFSIQIDFDNLEQTVTVEEGVIEYHDIPFVLFNNGQVRIEVCDFVDLDQEENEDITGVGMLMMVKNDLPEAIQLYGNGIVVNGTSNSEHGFDYCGEVDAYTSDHCGLILYNASPEDRVSFGGRFVIVDDATDNVLFETADFLIDVDFENGTITARITP